MFAIFHESKSVTVQRKQEQRLGAGKASAAGSAPAQWDPKDLSVKLVGVNQSVTLFHNGVAAGQQAGVGKYVHPDTAVCIATTHWRMMLWIFGTKPFH